ncbi:MAG: DUF4097 family beta strand repeat-containing protein [Gemmatimonadaceae bacterium]|nr:DUF4097 family beta strand repeat-containing protein [Gemmatimonadaceae bacterium]
MLRRTLLAALLAATSLTAQERKTDDSFKWNGTVASGRSVYVRNMNGGVTVEAGTGDQAEVRAVKRWRRGDPSEVKVTAEKTSSGDVLVCVIWEDRRTRCDESGYSSRTRDDDWSDRDDVSVHVTVRLPKGVKVDATTVNGGITIEGATAEVRARTVNGGIEAGSTGGPVIARTTNGGIKVRAGTLGTGDLDYSTVNGGITLELDGDANADFDARTVNGSISTDFPVTIQGNFRRNQLAGRLGKGGPRLSLRTVNGSIQLRKLP